MILGSFIPTNVGSFLGAAAGAYFGGLLDRQLFGPDQEVVEGPRVENTRVQQSAQGIAIPWLWGTQRMGGNVIWMDDTKEHSIEREEANVTIREFSYTQSFAVAFCRGPVNRVLRIWADTKMIFNLEDDREGRITVIEPGDLIVAQYVYPAGVFLSGITMAFSLYLGTSNQVADDLIESVEEARKLAGSNSDFTGVPAFRGTCYIRFSHMPIGPYGNRLPNISAEIATEGDDTDPYIIYDTVAGTNNDQMALTGDAFHVIVQQGRKWAKLNIVEAIEVLQIDYSAITADSRIPYNSGERFDIDERGNVYTSFRAHLNDCRLEMLDGDTLARKRTSTFEVNFTSFVQHRVVKNPLHPWLYSLESSFSRIWVTNRDTLSYGNSVGAYEINSNDIDYSDVSGLRFRMIDVNNNTGELYAVIADPAPISNNFCAVLKISSGGGVHITETLDITDNQRGGRFICYDPETNQIIVGSAGDTLSSTGESLLFIDPDTMTVLEKMEIPVNTLYSGGLSAWRRGVIGGFLWLGSLTTITRIDVLNYLVEQTYAPTPIGIGGGGIYDPTTHSYIVGTTGSFPEAVGQILLDRGTGGTVPLSQIVQDICEEVGMSALDVNVTELTDEVRGFSVRERIEGKSAINGLTDGYFFDAYEHNSGVLSFPKRAGDPVRSITDDDLACHTDGEARPQALVITRQEETELPRVVDVTFIDPNFNYDAGNQRERRLITSSEQQISLRFMLSLNVDEAKQIAVKALGQAWTGRDSFRFFLPRDHMDLDVTDKITLTEGNFTHTIRITEMNIVGQLIEVVGKRHDSSVYVSDATGVTPLSEVPSGIELPGPTRLQIVDTNTIRQGLDFPHLWAATQGITVYWIGADVFRSSSGDDWSLWTQTTKDAVIGSVIDAIPSVPDTEVWDDGTTITVALLDNEDSLASVSKATLLAQNGRTLNLGIFGDELIQWSTATAVTGAINTWELTGLLRGRYGSEWAVGTHAAGDRFVLIDESYVDPVSFSVENLDQNWYFTAVSAGTGLATSGQVYSLEPANIRSSMPLAPVHVAGTRDGSNNLTITWIRRSRIRGDAWMYGQAIPLAEASELYDIEVVDGGSVVRTFTDETSATVTYTAAQQTTDGLTPGDPVTVNIYQKSADVGRGFVTTVTV